MTKSDKQELAVLSRDALEKLIAKAVGEGMSHEINAQRIKLSVVRPMMTPSEAREMARCGSNILYAALKSGTLKSVKTGKGPKGSRKLIKHEEVEEWIKRGKPTAK